MTNKTQVEKLIRSIKYPASLFKELLPLLMDPDGGVYVASSVAEEAFKWKFLLSDPEMSFNYHARLSLKGRWFLHIMCQVYQPKGFCYNGRVFNTLNEFCKWYRTAIFENPM